MDQVLLDSDYDPERCDRTGAAPQAIKLFGFEVPWNFLETSSGRERMLEGSRITSALRHGSYCSRSPSAP